MAARKPVSCGGRRLAMPEHSKWSFAVIIMHPASNWEEFHHTG
jgi:hypothetical protein